MKGLKMNNVLEFPKKDIEYITGNKEKGEPTIVGVKCKEISIQLSSNLKSVLLGDIEIKQEELIAFVVATNMLDQLLINKKDNRMGFAFTVCEIGNDATIEEVKMCKTFDDAHSLMLALEDVNSFEPEKIKYKIIANKHTNY